jgi:rhodanese-related sulfurtransferase
MNISVSELKQQLAGQEKIELIDVREQYENEEFNIGGMLIPLGDLPQQIPQLNLSKDDKIIMYCRSGNRSGMAQFLMQEAGFKNVYNLEGGMIAWQEMEGK